MARRFLNPDYLQLRGRAGQRQPTFPPPTTPAAPTPTQRMSRLYVGQLPLAITEAALRKRFEVFGDLEQVAISRDSTNTSKPFGWLQYRHIDDALAAFHGMRNSTFEGEALDVRLGNEGQGMTTQDIPTHYTSMPLPPLPTEVQDDSSSTCDYQYPDTGHVCGDRFSSSSALMRHWSQHPWEARPLKCEQDPACVYAKRGFAIENERERHYTSAHSARKLRQFKCKASTCLYHKKGFETEKELNMHENVHSMDFDEHTCKHPGCSFESRNEKDVLVHMDRAHATDTMEDITKPSSAPSRTTNDWKPEEKRGLHEPRNSSRTGTVPRRRRDKHDKSSQQKQVGFNFGDEKPRHLTQYLEEETHQDYRPFKCQFSTCKMAREGFESKRELVSHETQEHSEALKDLANIQPYDPELLYDLQPSEETTIDPLNPAYVGTIRMGTTALPESSSAYQSSADFLHCNNSTCANTFTTEQEWRDHAKSCSVPSTTKRCSFTDCKGTFENNSSLSSHEYRSHGIRICSSLTCNRAFHQEEDAVDHMQQLHSNVFAEGRRPRLAFISTVPAWTKENGEDGFPYDPYRCALLNLTEAPTRKVSRQGSKKGKEPALDLYDGVHAPGTLQLTGSPSISLQPSSKPSVPQSDEALPRYSYIMGTSSTIPQFNFDTRSPLSNVSEVSTPVEEAASTQMRPKLEAAAPRRASAPTTSTVRRPVASQPTTPAQHLQRLRSPEPRSIRSPSPSTKRRPSNDSTTSSRDPHYRYNSDGSRYVNGAVIMSPDRHKVLVLQSKDESVKTFYDLPRGYREVNDDNGTASALREAWQKAGIVGRILKPIEPAPAEEPDNNGLVDWHSYFEVEVEKEREIWPNHKLWQRTWLTYREARVVLSAQPDAIRALERSTIFKRGGSAEPAEHSPALTPISPTVVPSRRRVSPPRERKVEMPKPRTKRPREAVPVQARKYSIVSPNQDNVAVWRSDILPWLRKNFGSVMGNNKNGAIELLRVRDRPTICITCTDPKALQLGEFNSVISGMFPLHIKMGVLARSGGRGGLYGSPDFMADGGYEVIEATGSRDDADSQDLGFYDSGTDEGSVYSEEPEEGDDEQEEDEAPTRAFPLPPVFGKYHLKPSCGAPIGVANDVDGSASAGTFGGIVIVVKDGIEAPYGLISHHVLEEKTDETELSVGVDECYLLDSRGARQFAIQQPSMMDLDETIDSLNMQLFYCKRDEKRYCDVDDGKTLKGKRAIVEALDDHRLGFGQIVYSSGYGLDNHQHQMDWALVGDIPSWRLEDNFVAGAESFYDLHYDGRPKPLYPVEKTFFNFLSDTFKDEDTKDMSDMDPLRRVHGVGSYSGIMDGLVSSETSFFRLDGIDSEEWFFTPRYNGGLGVKGDSGTWIFDDFGKAVGQIIAYNYSTNVTYFTRMDYLFEHIKHKTKATEVYIPFHGELSKWQKETVQMQKLSLEDRTARSDSVTDSGYGDSHTSRTVDTDITTPSQSFKLSSITKGDAGLGYAMPRDRA